MNRPSRNETAQFLTLPQAQKRMNLCRGTVQALAEESGALLRIGRSVRVDISRLETYVRKEYAG